MASHRVQIFSGINGLLIPGGAVSIFSSPYAEAATYLVDLAKLSNSAGEGTVYLCWGQNWRLECRCSRSGAPASDSRCWLPSAAAAATTGTRRNKDTHRIR